MKENSGNISFLKRLLLGKTFRGSDYITETQVIFFNVFTPLSICFASLLIVEVYLNNLKPFHQVLIDIFFLVSISLSYCYFLVSKNIRLYAHLISLLLLLYFPFIFYAGGINGSAALWMFVLPIIIYFVNEIKTGLIYTSLFNFFLIVVVIFFNKDILEVYTYSYLVRFFLSFGFYSLILIGYVVVTSKLNSLNRIQKVDLEQKNKLLNEALLLQKKAILQLSEKENVEKRTTRNLKSIINNTDDLIWLVDRNNRIELFNNAFRSTYKNTYGLDHLGDDISGLLEKHSSPFLDQWKDRYQDVFKSGVKKSFIDKHELECGVYKYIITDFYPIVSDNETVGITCFSRDITAQRKAKKEKEELARLNSTIIASLGEVVYDYDVIKDELTWNDAIYQVLGYNYTLMGKSLEQFYEKIHADDVELLIKEIEDLKEKGGGTPLDIRVLTKKRTYLWMQNRVNVLYNDDGVAIRLIGVLFNINDRKETELNQLQAVVKGVDLERKRIAGEIHDGLGQTLIATSLILSSLESQLTNDRPEEEKIQLKTVSDLINEAIDEGREISHSIMPKSLEDYGLIPSLKSLVNKISLAKTVKIDFHCNLQDDARLPIEIENNLYRVTQESLNNIIKHSEAVAVVLQLVAHKKSIILTIEDDGKGFGKLDLKDDEGLGLQNIKNRISSIGGILQIDTHEGYGTLITIEVELKKEI